MSPSVEEFLQDLQGQLNYDHSPIAIVLAAGHGKRIKSNISKMLHEIWGVPTSVRVIKAATKGLRSNNYIAVVGIKAMEVADAIGGAPSGLFAYQAEQLGTGHAARVALDLIDSAKNVGDIYIFPGDMGLLTEAVVTDFQKAFDRSGCGMMILTGIYDGDPMENHYGRIVRVPATDIEGRPSDNDYDKVIEIKEYKDLLAITGDYLLEFNGRRYRYTKEELLAIKEYNSGVYACQFDPINKHIRDIGTDNAQGEIYITDLIKKFNDEGIAVNAHPALVNEAVMGFNTKSVLYDMNNIYRAAIYEKLKDLITFEDKDDFFIADEVVEQLLEMAEEHTVLDIYIGKGVYIGPEVKLSRFVTIERNCILTANMTLGEEAFVNQNSVIE
ncbi:MAG: NTP transferase domain-containing protein [Candidatus Marinimicrobia bacterium]|nr:NTP transferase domain-containing protein [Candidatus Neomarinimicrobiota bacterium]